MTRYQFYLRQWSDPSPSSCVMLMVDEADQSPTTEELEESDHLSRLIWLGDTSIRLLPSGRHPEIFHTVRVGPPVLKAAA